MPQKKNIAHKWSILCTWLFAFVLGVSVAVFAGGESHPSWFILAIGAVVLVAGAVQLIVADKDGFIVRISLSIAGGLTLLLLTTLGALILR